MNYQQTIDFLYKQLPAYQKVGAKAFKKDLTNILQLCAALGNPHKKFKSIHIAGTNGKGSTAHMLAAVCQAEGYSTGLYTSPHLIDFRERIKINGQLIHKNSVIQFVKRIEPLIYKIKPSFFEITVAMAFYHFANKKVDVAIIETGLGGRLDSTNIIQPILSIITNISLEHQQFLGDTLAQIAGEKAGIIKPNIPVVIGSYQKETAPVFEKVAKQANSALVFAKNMFHTTKVKNQLNYNTYTISNSYKNTTNNFECDLKGAYQVENITTVLTSLAVLNKNTDLKVSSKSIKNGLKNTCFFTNFLGRWQTVQNEPKVIVDCAHNAAGIESIFRDFKLEKNIQLRIIFGCVSDKDLEKIAYLLPKNANYYVTQPSVARAKPFKETAATLQQSGLNIIDMDKTPSKILKKAINDSDKTDFILIIGSVFLVADILETYSNNQV